METLRCTLGGRTLEILVPVALKSARASNLRGYAAACCVCAICTVLVRRCTPPPPVWHSLPEIRYKRYQLSHVIYRVTRSTFKLKQSESTQIIMFLHYLSQNRRRRCASLHLRVPRPRLSAVAAAPSHSATTHYVRVIRLFSPRVAAVARATTVATLVRPLMRST